MTLAAAIDKRPFNGRLNLDICSLYGLLGAPLLALEHLERMEIKYIQMGSLASHLIVPTLLAYNQNSCARRLLIETILLFEEHTKDAGETIFTAYQKGTFTKVLVAYFACPQSAFFPSHGFRDGTARLTTHECISFYKDVASQVCSSAIGMQHVFND